MNIALYFYNLKDKCQTLFGIIGFKFFQKPLWSISYNGGKNKFDCNGRLLNCKVIIEGNGHKVMIGKNVTLKNVLIQITGSNNTLVINEDSAISEHGRIRIEDTDNTVMIGNNAHVSGIFLSAADKGTTIKIGDNLLASADVVIRTSDAHSILNEENKRINLGQNVTIGNNVWISYGVTILKGAVIGDNCVIGTQAVVPGKTFPAGSIVVGNPAKVVKEGIKWDSKRIIE